MQNSFSFFFFFFNKYFKCLEIQCGVFYKPIAVNTVFAIAVNTVFAIDVKKAQHWTSISEVTKNYSTCKEGEGGDLSTIHSHQLWPPINPWDYPESLTFMSSQQLESKTNCIITDSWLLNSGVLAVFNLVPVQTGRKPGHLLFIFIILIYIIFLKETEIMMLLVQVLLNLFLSFFLLHSQFWKHFFELRLINLFDTKNLLNYFITLLDRKCKLDQFHFK